MTRLLVAVTLAAACSSEPSPNIDAGINDAAFEDAAKPLVRSQQAYVKTPTGGMQGDGFGVSVALASDGNTLVVGSVGRMAAFVYARSNDTWVYESTVQPASSGFAGGFGGTVAISGDGDTLVVGADGDRSNATGIDGNESDTSLDYAGALFVFVRSGTQWTRQAYIKASNTDARDFFGTEIAVSADGNTIAVGVASESSSATGIDGDQTNNDALSSGAVYLFSRSGTAWSQQAYIKASNTEAADLFGIGVALSDDANTLAVGAHLEDGGSAGQLDNTVPSAGAVYIFTRTGAAWAQSAYVKAPTPASEGLGLRVGLSGDGNTLVASAVGDSTGANSSGAFDVFRRGTAWTHEARLKPSVVDDGDRFAESLVISRDGSTVVAGSWFEDSAARGVNGDASDDSASNSGAAWVFEYAAGTWTQDAYLKASNTDAEDSFAFNIRALAVSNDGATIAVGAPNERSSSSGINGDQTDNIATGAGAVYVFR